MTIKAQGQMFHKVAIHLPAPVHVFSHGQLYIAFSKTRSLNDISVKINDMWTQGQFSNYKYYITKNIVYKEVL